MKAKIKIIGRRQQRQRASALKRQRRKRGINEEKYMKARWLASKEEMKAAAIVSASAWRAGEKPVAAKRWRGGSVSQRRSGGESSCGVSGRK